MFTDIIAQFHAGRKTRIGIGRKIMLAVVVALYFLGTIATAVNWAFTRYSFITHGENFWTVYTTFYNVSPVKQKPSTLFMVENVVTGVTGGLQSILSDIAMVCILQLASAVVDLI